jgi:hypothetical protein
MSTESVSSDSSLQLPQLVEDQLSEDELETVVGGVLYDVVSCLPDKLLPVSPAGGGNPSLLFPQVPLPPGGPIRGVGGGIQG